MTREERFRGTLLGLACGDALGAAVEFRAPGSFPPLTGMVGGGPFHLEPGYWTDDTSMAMCLAESLLERLDFDPVDQLRRYLKWYREGYWSSTGKCFDIGNATRRALERFEKTGAAYCGSDDPSTAGNGSVMRLAPVVLFFSNDAAQAVEYAGESSRTTHEAPVCIEACRYFASLLLRALAGRPKSEVLQAGEEGGPYGSEIQSLVAGSFLRRNPPQIRASGYVPRTVEAALWAFASTATFEEGLLKAVNLGDDADTVGAIYGQLAGAYYGERAIPAEWRALLHRGDEIAAYATRLCR